MIEYKLVINASFRAETLERILRVIRHRGFSIKFLHLEPGEVEKQFIIQLTVVSERPIQQLYTQLNKLSNVDDVKVVFNASQSKLSVTPL